LPACPPFRFPRILGEAIAYGRQGTPIGGYLDEVGGPLARQDIRDLVHWLRETAGVEPLVIDPEKGWRSTRRKATTAWRPMPRTARGSIARIAPAAMATRVRGAPARRWATRRCWR